MSGFDRVTLPLSHKFVSIIHSAPLLTASSPVAKCAFLYFRSLTKPVHRGAAVILEVERNVVRRKEALRPRVSRLSAVNGQAGPLHLRWGGCSQKFSGRVGNCSWPVQYVGIFWVKVLVKICTRNMCFTRNHSFEVVSKEIWRPSKCTFICETGWSSCSERHCVHHRCKNERKGGNYLCLPTP